MDPAWATGRFWGLVIIGAPVIGVLSIAVNARRPCNDAHVLIDWCSIDRNCGCNKSQDGREGN